MRIRLGFGTSLFLLTTSMLSNFATAQPDSLHVLAGSTPGLVAQAHNLGLEDPNKQITVYVWLKRHDESAFQTQLRQVYTKGSPNYHRWLTNKQYAAQFGPTAAEAGIVSGFLESKGLNIVKVDPLNQFVSAHGTVADVQIAFHVQIDRFSRKEGVYRSNTGDAAIEGPAGALVSAVLGLDDIAPCS
jgi:subtilase family serine protease